MCGILSRIKKIFLPKTSAPVNSGAAKRVLAIDDDRIQRTMIQTTLQKRGYSVFTAETGESGLNMAFELKPDLVILDVVLPVMSGHEVCRRLKADQRTKDIPVIFLTSQDSPGDVIEHYELGADIHLTKPINSKELVTQVQISLGEK